MTILILVSIIYFEYLNIRIIIVIIPDDTVTFKKEPKVRGHRGVRIKNNHRTLPPHIPQ